MTTTVRFAPSPTGYLHVGNIRTAVLNWLFARSLDGQFVLRLDDTDPERSTAAFADAIIEDLGWLGLSHDRLERQSERLDAYDAAAERLKSSGRLYACYETADELERKRKRQLLRGLPPVYDREGLTLSSEDRMAFEAEERRPHWRFKLEHRVVVFEDAVRGSQSVDCASLSDPVLIREDGSYLYTLPSVIDDVDFAVTHVVRGEDHVSNSAPQIQLFEAFDAPVPVFAHHSLLVAADGGRLSKRSGAEALRDLRARGIEAMTVMSLAATIGTSDPVAAHQSAASLIDNFAFSKLSRAPARFDPEELAQLNAKLLHGRAFEAVAEELATLGISGGEAFWLAVRGNCEVLVDARRWWDVATGPVVPDIDEPEYIAEAARLLPPAPWDAATWKGWTDQVGEASKRTGRSLFMPLRRALTGEARGPEMGEFLPFIGPERALERLSTISED